jgi:hypothetical protein
MLYLKFTPILNLLILTCQIEFFHKAILNYLVLDKSYKKTISFRTIQLQLNLLQKVEMKLLINWKEEIKLSY